MAGDKGLEPFDVALELLAPEGIFSGTETAAGPITSVLYAFPLPPMQYAHEAPFSVSFAPGLDGGLTAHENGVTGRAIAVSGTFGLQSKGRPNWVSLSGLSRPLFERARIGDLHKTEGPNDGPSTGTHLLQLLEDRIINTYAECKRHPQFGALTRLVFHNLKLDQHWEVVPTNWSVQARNTYFTYSLVMTAVRPFDGRIHRPENTTKSLLSTYGKVMKAISEARGAIQNIASKIRRGLKTVQNLVNDAVRVVSSAASLVTDLTRIATDVINAGSSLINAASRMVGTIESAITAPAAVFTTAANFLDAVEALETRVERFDDRVRGAYASALRDLKRNANQLAATGKTMLGSPAQLTSQRAVVAYSEEELDLSDEIGTRLKALNTQTTEPPANARAQARDARPVKRREYKSAIRVAVTEGTTLRQLALQHIGDELAWPDIAKMNNLSYPFISARRVRGTVAPGDKILVPLTSSAVVKIGPDVGLIGAGATKDDMGAALGVDLRLEADDDGLYDLVLGPAGTDVKVHRGVTVLQQDLEQALRLELGRDPLTPGEGLPSSLIGPGTRQHIELVRYSLKQLALRDPRVISVTEKSFEVDLDTIRASYEVEHTVGRTLLELVP